jgi:Na+/H+-dicarboxylate symporter/ABC-type amino acid transport substrate-binding protein
MTDAPSAQRRAALRVSHIAIGLAAGVATGLFFGERARILQPAADGFVRLLQMAVLPYLFVSIVSNIGGLRADDLRRLGVRVPLVLIAVWTIVLATALLMPFTFPASHSGAFFSTTLLEQPAPLDLVDLYIPNNPFFALANNIVPAVVVFSIIIGAALMGLPEKESLLQTLSLVSATISRATRFVTRLTPIGIFAIAAVAAGTLRVDEASRLQIYLVAYTAFGALITAWTLPGLISAMTPVPVRDIFTAVREPLLTATIIGDLFIVLPALIDASRTLVATYAPDARDAKALPDVILPIAYNFPHSGKLLTMSFVLFAGWFSGAPIHFSEYPRLAIVSLATLFGSVTAAIPFLLDLFRVPADTFQLFIASSIINSRVGTAVAGMHLVAIAIIGACASAGVLRWRPAAIAKYVIVTVLLTLAVVGSTRLLASRMLGQPTAMTEVLDAMRIEQPVESRMEPAAVARTTVPATGTRLQTIDASKTLRVGYLSSSLPFAFQNGHQELVGFDVALMHRLARELGVTLTFVPVPRTALDQPDGVAAVLASGACDIIIGGVAITTRRAGTLQLSSSYMSETLGFIVPDRDRERFASWDAIRAAGAITLAIPAVPYFMDVVHERVPQARIVAVQSVDELFGANGMAADAFVMPAERGSAWALRYPQYAVVVPLPDAIKVPLAFALPRGETDFVSLVNTWLDLQRGNGTIAALYDYWILGRTSPQRAPRWSVIRDVLHCVD